MIEVDSRFRGNDGAEIEGTTKVDETPALPGHLDSRLRGNDEDGTPAFPEHAVP